MAQKSLVESAAGDDPGSGLRAVRSLRELADRLETLQVSRARDLGWSLAGGRGRVGGHPAGSPQEARQEKQMFERFAKDAREVVVSAQEVAREAGSRSVDTRHVLVALLRGSGQVSRALAESGSDVGPLTEKALADLRAAGLDGEALAGLGIDLDAVRRQADAVFGPDALEQARRSPTGHIPFARDAKKALELALRETVRLEQRTIQPGHLMLGIVRADSPGRALLLRSGVDTDALRTALEAQARAA